MIKKNNHDSHNIQNGNHEKKADKSLSDNKHDKTDNIEEIELDDVKTQQFSHDQLRDGIVDSAKQDENIPDFPQASREVHFRIPDKSPYRPLLVILAVVVLCFAALIVVQMIRTHKNTLVLKKATESSSPVPAESEILKSLRKSKARVNEEEQTKKYVFGNGVFQGSAPLRARETGPVLSENQDPEIAALVDAFNVRYRMIFDIKVSKQADKITETCRGVFRGFGIHSIQVKQAGQIIRDEMSLSTPSGGMIRVADKLLESVIKTSYDQIQNDLDRSGIAARKEIISEKNILQIQLRVGDHWEKKSAEAYPIYGDGVEDIKLGMGIAEMNAILSGQYRILKRKIMVGNQFETILKIDDRQRTPLFFIYERNERIWGIEIVNTRYKTLRGIKIGSTLGMVRIFYTDVNIVSIPGKLTYLFSSDSQNNDIKFILSDDNRVDFDQEEFPFDLKITSILIGNSPYLKN